MTDPTDILLSSTFFCDKETIFRKLFFSMLIDNCQNFWNLFSEKTFDQSVRLYHYSLLVNEIVTGLLFSIMRRKHDVIRVLWKGFLPIFGLVKIKSCSNPIGWLYFFGIKRSKVWQFSINIEKKYLFLKVVFGKKIEI